MYLRINMCIGEGLNAKFVYQGEFIQCKENL